MLQPQDLHVVSVISNPHRYARRYKLYHEFAKRVEDSGATFHTVEHAFGEREHEVTAPGHERHHRVRGSHELWHKENLLNIGVARLPHDWRYVATIDADLTFARPDWVMETLHQLQHTPVVQMFSEVSNLSPNGEFLGHGLSFVESLKRGMTFKTPQGVFRENLYHHPKKVAPLPYPHPGSSMYLGSPGGAWAYARNAWDHLGGLIDYSLVGSGDYFMAAGLYGLMHMVVADGYHPAFTAELINWQTRALHTIRKNVGVVPGLILHHWHGKMSKRGYGDRWQILVKHQFNPLTDLKRDSQGLLQLHDDGSERMRALRDDLRAYTSSRNEDSIDVE